MKGIDILNRKTYRRLTYFRFLDADSARAWCLQYGIPLDTVVFLHHS